MSKPVKVEVEVTRMFVIPPMAPFNRGERLTVDEEVAKGWIEKGNARRVNPKAKPLPPVANYPGHDPLNKRKK